MAHFVEAEAALADAAGMFYEPLGPRLERFAQLIEPHLASLDVSFDRHLKSDPAAKVYSAPQLKALSQVSSGAAVRILSGGRSLADFLEQVAYNSRRLAKLNVPPEEVVAAIREYDRLIDPLLANRYADQAAALQPLREQLYFCTVMALNNAYYQVREAETQAFYGLLRAEMDATDLDDLLRRFIVILTRTFRAQSGRLIPIGEPPQIPAKTLKRLARPRYIAGGSVEEELVVDSEMHGKFQSYWSIPYFSDRRLAGLIQFGFPTAYRWLPRELDLLNAFAERCLRAAERTKLIHDLAEREEQVRGLAGHLMQAQEEERLRISREIHDEAGQSMLFLRLHLEMLEKAAPPELQQKLADARGVAERIITEIRRVVAALSPSVLQQLGLAAAIRHLSTGFRKLHTIKLHVRLDAHCDRLPRALEATIYRVVQECYQNIAKHSQASHVNLWLGATDTVLELNVEDDGIGFAVDPAVANPKSFGLKGMRERVALWGGCLEVRSRPGHGTKISVRIPIPGPAAISGSG